MLNKELFVPLYGEKIILFTILIKEKTPIIFAIKISKNNLK